MTSTIVQNTIDQTNHVRLQGKSVPASSPALVNLTTIGSLSTGTSFVCEVTTAHAAKKITEWQQTAGSCSFDVSSDLTSGAQLLQSLVSDFTQSLHTVATRMNIQLEGGTVSCSGKLDVSGRLGATDEHGHAIPVQFRHISLNLRLECWEEDKGRIPELIRTTEQSSTQLMEIRQDAEVQVKIGHLGRIGPDCVRDEHAKVTYNHMGYGIHRMADISAMITV